MENKIKEYLTQLEQEKGIEILLACETGSRAWGFPSPDSDYDVRIIYKHDRDWYLGLVERKDTIERMLDNNEIDISGWDLRKSLRLLWKSNPPLLERIQSPTLYSVNADFLSGITQVAQASYSRIATVHHYLSMAKKAHEAIDGQPEYRLKKFFYALRASVACLWILDREDMPPIVFQTMLSELPIPEEVTKRIYELIDVKATISEAYLHTGDTALIDFMALAIARTEREAKTLPGSTAKLSDFNSFFLKMLTT